MHQVTAPIDIYARRSRAGDREQRSTGGQVAACIAILEERGLPIGQTFVDEGKSAWRKDVRRPGWEALMIRLESGASGGCIMYELSRFSRDPEPTMIRLLDAANRGLLILDSESEYDLTAPNGKKQFRDALAGAAYYSDDLQRKVKRGKARKARAGQVDRRRAFGFEDDGVTVRESEAAVLRFLVEHFLHDDPQEALLAYIARCGVRTITGGCLNRHGLRKLLTRPRNKGVITSAGVPVSHLPGPPIISEALHDAVVAKIAARRPGRPASAAYLCTGSVFCGLCGRPLSGRPRAGKSPYPDGSVRREYWCSPSGKGGCGHISIDQRALDTWAADWAIRALADPAHAEAIASAERETDEARAALSSEHDEIRHTISEIDERVARRDRGWTLERADRICDPLYIRLEAIEAERAALPVVMPLVLPRATRTISDSDKAYLSWLEAWTDGTPSDQRALLRRALAGSRLVVGRADPVWPGAVRRRVEIGR
jgi:site-specific DNA recombinase